MKKVFKTMAFTLLGLVLSMNLMAVTVTYTVKDASNVTTSGTAPEGSNATMTTTNGSLSSGTIQMVADANCVLTLSGFAGKKITGITLSVKSNSSKGQGSFTAVAGTTTIASIADSKFNTANWNGSWSTTVVDKVLTMTNNSYTIGTSENVVLTMAASANSLYIKSWKITYEDATGPAKTLDHISIKTAPSKTSYDAGDKFNPAGLVITKSYTDETSDDLEYAGNEGVFSFEPTLTTTLTTSNTSVKITVGGKSTTQAITVTAFTPTAGEYEITLNNELYGISTGNNGTEQSTVKKGITVVSGCKSNASSKTYYDAGHIRYYTDSYLKLTAPTGFEITKVVFTKASSDWNGSITSTPEGYTEDTKTWEGQSDQVDFAFGKQNRATAIKVTLAAASTLELIGIEATGTPSEFWKGDEFNHNGITVTALWDDESETDVTDKAEYSGYDMSNAGKQTITVTYKGETDTYEIEVKTIANTKETAYTPAKAIELIDAGKDLSTYVYVTGTVSKIVTEYSGEFGNITFDVSADGTTTGEQFRFYRTFKGETEDDLIVWESAIDAPKVGDDVIGYGKLTKYYSTYEFEATSHKDGEYTIYDTYNYVVSLTRQATLKIGDITVAEGEDIVPVIETNIPSGTYSINYVSDNEEAVLADGDEMVTMGVGEANITATISAEGYKQATAEFKVTVTSNATLESVVVSGYLTKTEYTIGDNFDRSGLVATAIYSDESEVDVTTTATWTISPEKLENAAASKKVTVKAKFNEVESEENEYFVKVNKKVSSIAIEDITVEKTRTATIVATTTPTNATLTYEITEGSDKISIVNGVITGMEEGTAKVKATYAETATYVSAEKEFTVNVIPFVPVATWVAAEWATANNISSNTDFKEDYATLNVGDNIATLSWAKGNGGSSVPAYNNGAKDARLYRYNTLTITGTGANFISGIDFNFMDNLMGSDMATDCGEYVEDATNKKSTWTGFDQQVVLTNTGTENVQAHIASITIHYTVGTLTTLTIDDINLKLTDEPKTIVYNTNKPNPVIVYSGYDENVITIANGVVTPVSTGTTTITATIAQSGTYSAVETTFTVKVTNKTLPTLSFAEESYTAKLGEAFTAPTLNNPQGLTITYSTTDAGVADVNSTTGEITHKKEGSVTITATSEETDQYESNTASYTLNVVNPNVDVLTAELIGSNSYADWKDKQDKTGTLYAGNSQTCTTSPNEGAIQMRSSGSNSGIVSTKTVGYLRGINVKFTTAPAGTGSKFFQIYGSHSAYTSAADLYNDETKGTLIASIKASGDVDYTYTDNNFEYIGVRSGDGAMYIESITLTWQKAALYSVTKIANKGSFTLSKSTGKVGDGITITDITPDFNYELESIKAYKDGDEGTPVTLSEITGGYTFNLPEYDVVVEATFKSKGTPEGDQIALVAKSGEDYYAISTTVSGNFMKATKVTVKDNKVIVADEAAKSEILWVKCAVQGKENTYVFLTEGLQYLAGSSSTNLGLSANSYNWTWTGKYYYVTIGTSNRSPELNGTSDFRNYSVSEWESNMVKEMPIEIAEPEPDFVLEGKAAGAYATICLAGKIDHVENATLFHISHGDINKVEFEEVTDFSNEPAGMPYLVQVTKDGSVQFFCDENVAEVAAPVTPEEANGFVGRLAEGEEAITSETALLVSGGKLYKVGTGCYLTQNHAYIEVNAINPVAKAPNMAARRVTLYNAETQTPTNFNGLNGNMKAQKVMKDGQFYIIREAKMYNAQGIEVQ